MRQRNAKCVRLGKSVSEVDVPVASCFETCSENHALYLFEIWLVSFHICHILCWTLANWEICFLRSSMVTALFFSLKVSITINGICSLGCFSLSFTLLKCGNIIHLKSSIDLFVFGQWLSEKVTLDSDGNFNSGRYQRISLSWTI